MKIKSGKELTQLEIIKRLDLMGVKYDTRIVGKNYYINLYDKEIQSPVNQSKINQELIKDKRYQDYLSNKLRRSKQTWIEVFPCKEKESKECYTIKYIFHDFNIELFNEFFILITTRDFIQENKNDIKRAISKSINFFENCKNFANSVTKKVFRLVSNFLDKINCYCGNNKYFYVYIIIFFSLIIIMFIILFKSRKKNSYQRESASSTFKV